MIEERGLVTALEPGAVWVQTQRQSTCSACALKAGCGQGLSAQFGGRRQREAVRVSADLPLAVGDAVVLGVREDLLLSAAVQVYLLPLLGLFAGALVAEQLAWAEPWLVLSAVGGFIAACAAVRWRSRRAALDPCARAIVLRAVERDPITVL
ncbi:SoxR reducing system RseC family protein [Pseudomonas sp. 5P_3.1_Bac2]|uniref:SoxR reducing system RseC family protein n=1 Tax=Pseudomonas sp. 5P_3.1_Bac2 TaxID=2971617 RepID=UPI0021C9139C|nr:SoxR reducing system RseC family protein [Pseudomonas sp. 5P_3.1_Bac2]MCU1715926.1 SoxR reducing system RseC family protein [Pseudomonas sp. 5P_3.1_Bac2]